MGGKTPLAPEASYTFSRNLTIPNNIDTGNFYLLFEADEDRYQQETNEADNLRAVSINVNATDLTVSAPTSPTSIKLGEAANISWTVTNIGIGRATANWSDVVYLSSDQILDASDLFLSSSAAQTSLEAGKNYTSNQNIILPGNLATGNYYLLFVTDRHNDRQESNENNNIIARSIKLTAPNLSVSSISIPNATIAQSGQSLTVNWTVNNTGTAIATGSWSDRIYLSTDSTFDARDTLLGQFTHNSPLAAGAIAQGNINWNIPLELSGNYHLLVVTDAEKAIKELSAEDNNITVSAIGIELAPYADLAVSSVTAPPLIIGDHATVEIGWQVTNLGTGRGRTNSWTDKIIISSDDIVGNSDDKVLGQYTHTGGLNPEESYQRRETITLPPDFEGRYRLFVQTDTAKTVFENSRETNNQAAAPNFFDVIPIPYADLVISTLTTDGTSNSGQPLTVSWTVKNQGIGITNTSSWADRLFLASDPEGKNIIANLGTFERAGALAAGGSYNRSVQVNLPNGISGNYYIIASTSGPEEFIYTTNNTQISEAIQVSLTPPPDLKVTEIIAPAAMEAGGKIDLAWTISNDGTGKGEPLPSNMSFVTKEPSLQLPPTGKITFIYLSSTKLAVTIFFWEA